MPIFDETATVDQVAQAFVPQIKGRTFVITGAGQPSIGSQIAKAISHASPEHILIASRTASKVEPVLSAIKEIDPSIKATFVQIDLSDHDSVRRAAKEILAATSSKIDILINSAGNMAIKEYTLDKQGIEISLSANHVGHFLLANLLAPALIAAAASNKEHSTRIVNLTSKGYTISPFRFDDYNFSDGKTYDCWTGYGQAKTANILFSYGLTKHLRERGVVSFAAHPGSNLDTKLGSHLSVEDYSDILPIAKRNTGRDFVFEEPRFKSFEQIAATPLIAALDPEITAEAPAYLENSRIDETYEYAHDPKNAEKLWKLSEKLVGEEFNY
ncbi:NAD(P)-binding protein [Hypoxylon trugodes]|uniref:NAD(P)-binding protein n=1 Tax=Hypoxylon trugodes TaxID=326681 RepID=UPI00219F7C42|nr:NAD(P)-binding protein [Hypoxylon trugodes]KAI1393013.1 NAD(P)-binding protein [Hypoxylon trugodes]